MLEQGFRDWLAEGGARTFDIQPATFAGNLRGVQALALIEPGTWSYESSPESLECLSSRADGAMPSGSAGKKAND